MTSPGGPGPGPIGLVGSGEFTPATEAVDLALLEGRNRRVVFLPTAAAPEGAERTAYWVELGRTHYRRLGVDALPLMVLSRGDADSPEAAREIAGAGLIYLSGGDPAFLAATLAGTRVGTAIRDAWLGGSAVAGCSAGAMALTESVPDIRNRLGAPVPGLGLVAGLAVLPHFDRIEHWLPGAVQWAVDRTPRGAQLIGIDEETAVVGGPLDWQVMGRGCAWLIETAGERVRYGHGSVLSLRGLAGSSAHDPALDA